ncbi:hypothetical protein BCR34DRAFT_555169 [Clohesyomyces aquaticus]|uniref:Uncharacterized protein n=1 Tax=Clohesyomyces aquaticus TaxID=1231657 RepID=A0A1Y2A5J6_9PLEO|nr:hypothetical protein BCR34DRAFT_555169 [Clohesyomyces aquaticus]
MARVGTYDRSWVVFSRASIPLSTHENVVSGLSSDFTLDLHAEQRRTVPPVSDTNSAKLRAIDPTRSPGRRKRPRSKCDSDFYSSTYLQLHLLQLDILRYVLSLQVLALQTLLRRSLTAGHFSAGAFSLCEYTLYRSSYLQYATPGLAPDRTRHANHYATSSRPPLSLNPGSLN